MRTCDFFLGGGSPQGFRQTSAKRVFLSLTRHILSDTCLALISTVFETTSESVCLSVHPWEISEFLRRGFASPQNLPRERYFGWGACYYAAYSSNGTISGDRKHLGGWSTSQGCLLIVSFDGRCAVWRSDPSNERRFVVNISA